MTHGNGKSFFAVTHTSAEDVTTLAHPRGWARKEVEGDLYIHIKSSKSSSFKSIYLNMHLIKGLSGRL